MGYPGVSWVIRSTQSQTSNVPWTLWCQWPFSCFSPPYLFIYSFIPGDQERKRLPYVKCAFISLIFEYWLRTRGLFGWKPVLAILETKSCGYWNLHCFYISYFLWFFFLFQFIFVHLLTFYFFSICTVYICALVVLSNVIVLYKFFFYMQILCYFIAICSILR